jgi:hypothetical protein
MDVADHGVGWMYQTGQAMGLARTQESRARLAKSSRHNWTTSHALGISVSRKLGPGRNNLMLG